MSNGISGSNPTGGTISGYPVSELLLIEQRTTNAILLTYLSQAGGQDQINILRTDEAFVLQLPTPIPGAGR